MDDLFEMQIYFISKRSAYQDYIYTEEHKFWNADILQEKKP